MKPGLPYDLVRFSLDESYQLELDVSFLLVAAILLVVVGPSAYKIWRQRGSLHMVKMNIRLGNIGAVELRPNRHDLQVAHRIWTELVTRKAAQPIDPEEDIIVEVYDSWYALFSQIRGLISKIPAHLIRSDASTRELVRVATTTLREGLRPHLTHWQGRFRHWYQLQKDLHPEKSPQELQREFPQFDEMVADVLRVNGELAQYADELKKIVDGQ